ncbi:MAG: hypothetical protein IJE44_02935 [Clostridia bacterium]|nr:hypothetical protein [Clostridia bacterium]
MEFKNIPNKFRPIPFWSWNEKLDTKETARQVKLMYEAGLGGFIMHARGGLQTEYMGDEWFENIGCSIENAKELGTNPWVYDENGWPSGFGNGKINGKGEEYQQKYLRMEKGEKNTPNTICNIDGNHFYYEINPFYVDVLDSKVTDAFIEEIYEPYYKKYKNQITGFFSDEPQISRNGIPWSLVLPAEYKAKYGEDLLLVIDELFIEKGNYKDTRVKFWKLITDLFSNNFMKRLYDWCVTRNLEFTGHMVCEGTLLDQLTSNGAIMPHYEYFTIPGMDWLTRDVRDELHCHQVGSAAQQLGKKQVLSESFGLSGHNTSFEEFRKVCEWQMVKGINLFCQHLEGYSLRGLRKRDYPPAMFYQQPWWEEYKTFNDAISRVGMILAEGKPECDTLVIHPQTTAWTLYNNGDNKGLDELNDAFIGVLNKLQDKHIKFHLGDETLIERHGSVDGDTFVIGEMRYKTVVILPDTVLLDNTKALIDEYKQNGGRVATEEEIAPNDIVDNPNVRYTKRVYDGFDVHYFVNPTNEKQKANIRDGAKIVDIVTGEVKSFGGEYEFSPYDSLLVIDDGTARVEAKKEELKNLSLEGEWNIAEQSENVLTLDYCKYSFDGEIIEDNGYVLNIQERACALGRPVEIKQEFKVMSGIAPEKLYLAIEMPENFEIKVNGVVANNTPCGHFLDTSFKKVDIAKYFKAGENKIELKTIFKQSDKFYESLKKAYVFESELNKLTYDMEIEPVYLVGDFSVETKGEFEKLDKKAVRYSGEFTIGAPKEKVTLNNIEKQGFPFFAGKITVEKTVSVDDVKQKIAFDKKGINAVLVEVNGNFAGKIIWNPTELDLSEYLKEGENNVRLTLVNNLRNMLGPHHLEEGESHCVLPASFLKEKCVWVSEPMEWNDGYCFVETGLM